MGKRNPLRERWLSQEGAALAAESTARLLLGRSMDGIGLGTYGGRWDLRFLPLSTTRRLERFQKIGDSAVLGDIRLESLDLTNAGLEGLRFFGVTVENCRFDGATCQDWRLWGTVINGCTFEGTDLRSSVIGSWYEDRRNEWYQVDFTRADFRGATCRAALFEDCVFADANLLKLSFEQCTLIRCRFAGALRQVVFDGREISGHAMAGPLAEIDFTAARFDQVEFMGNTLDRVTLPEDPDLQMINHYRCVIEFALKRVDTLPDSLSSRMLRSEFLNRLKMMRAADEDNVFNRRDYVNSGGQELAELVDVLFAEGRAHCQ